MNKNKIRVGIDIDDTLCNSYEMNFASVKHLQKRLKKLSSYHKLNMKKDLSNYFNENNYDDFNRKLKQYHMNNNTMYPKVFAREVINFLKSKDFEIYIITARMNFLWNGSVKKYLKKWLKTHHIKYDKILTNRTDKENVCQENNIDIMIDDSPNYVSKINEKGIKTILFSSHFNKDYSHNLNRRAETWLDVFDVFKDDYNIPDEIISFD